MSTPSIVDLAQMVEETVMTGPDDITAQMVTDFIWDAPDMFDMGANPEALVRPALEALAALALQHRQWAREEASTEEFGADLGPEVRIDWTKPLGPTEGT